MLTGRRVSDPGKEVTLTHRNRDVRIFTKLVDTMGRRGVSQMPPGRLALEIGKFFIGRPYLSGTLEARGGERLVVNLRAFDCFTFVENVVALSRLLGSGDRSFLRFKKLLQRIRYRGGRLRGYPSRLHYFSEWVFDNGRMGFIRDVTAGEGGKPYRNTINFMTENPGTYPALKDEGDLKRMRAVERAISKRPLFVIPKERLRRMEGRIREGDVIAIATTQKGLDVQHVGLAVKVRGRIHLLHASSIEGKVVLSRETLYRYIMGSK
jgi:hypothetical protein